MTNPTPRKVEWSGPDGWTVWAGEDGCHIRSRGGDSLEMPEAEQLFSLWSDARAAAESERIASPKPPTREELRARGSIRLEAYAAHRAVRAIQAEFNPPADTPF